MTTNFTDVLETIFHNAIRNRVVTPDQYQIVMDATTSSVDVELQKMANRFLYGIRRGWVKIA